MTQNVPNFSEGLLTPGYRTICCLDGFPGLNFVKDFKEYRTKKHFIRCLRSILSVLHLTDQILTHSICCPIRIGKSKGVYDRIICPWAMKISELFKIDLLPLSSKSPITIVDGGGGEVDGG
jgi:hypothetical protein